jgi:hypothetical protein
MSFHDEFYSQAFSKSDAQRELSAAHDQVVTQLKSLAEQCAEQSRRAMSTSNYFLASTYSQTMSSLLKSIAFLERADV